ncbi:hypothetical protein ACFVRD_22705 [Streptomyces sp. NPDC057908]|uniref:DUF7507 domain-containing protein n=1 Tax=Streptomyces sp. NPDC057908 TaxID=3346276 RepID=UPI0036E2A940
MQYSYTVTNTGSTTVHDVLVSDDRVTKVTCDATTLAPGASTTCHGTYTITQADANACKKTKSGCGKLCPVTNVAVAAGTDPQGNQIAGTPARVTIEISKPRPPKPPHKKPPHHKPAHKKPVHKKPVHKKPVHKRSHSEEGSNGQGQA